VPYTGAGRYSRDAAGQDPTVLSDRTPGRLDGPPAPGFQPVPIRRGGATQLSAVSVPPPPTGSCGLFAIWRLSRSHHVSAELGTSALRGLPWYRLGFKLTLVGQPGVLRPYRYSGYQAG